MSTFALTCFGVRYSSSLEHSVSQACDLVGEMRPWTLERKTLMELEDAKSSNRDVASKFSFINVNSEGLAGKTRAFIA